MTASSRARNRRRSAALLRTLAPSTGACALLAAWYVLMYGNCTRLFFYLDDFRLLGQASRLTTLADLAGIFWPGPESTLLYRPLSQVGYFWLLRSLFGYDAAPYHAVQLCMQVANATLVYLIASTILRSRWAGLGVALLYAAAPGHAIASYWPAAFSTTGTAFWYFACVLAWLRLHGRRRDVVCAALLVVALLNGEAAITLPVALTLTSLVDRQSPRGRRMWGLVPAYGIAVAYGMAKAWYFRFGVLTELPDPMGRAYVLSQYGPRWAPAAVVETLGFYGACSLSWLYRAVGTPSLLDGIAALWFLALLTALLVARRSAAGRVIAVGLSFFVVGLGPALILPQHRFIYLIGVGAFGSSLALVAAACAVPRVGPGLASGLVAATLLYEALAASTAVRESETFRVMQAFQVGAAGWLQTVEERADLHRGIQEVIVPRRAVTSLVFEAAEGHRLFFDATYSVRLVDADQLPTSTSPTHIVVAAAPPWLPGTKLPGQRPQWNWLRWSARLCLRDAWPSPVPPRSKFRR